MSARVCSIEGCGKPHWARGWCANHYNRWYHRGGDPAVMLKPSAASALWWCECPDSRLDGWGQCNACGRVPEWFVRSKVGR